MCSTTQTPKVVMPGLGPGIHVFGAKTWMAGTKPGHDER
ncbi:MAG: hypothetical protein JWP84_5376 [Tardiphaga sp.]|nr:hypothetical protein [Tardiphaga sp.]